MVSDPQYCQDSTVAAVPGDAHSTVMHSAGTTGWAHLTATAGLHNLQQLVQPVPGTCSKCTVVYVQTHHCQSMWQRPVMLAAFRCQGDRRLPVLSA